MPRSSAHDTAAEHGPDCRPTNFDLFVLGLSGLSLVNILLIAAPLDTAVTNVVLIVDGVLCLVFLADFLLRLKRARVKRQYFIHDGGWLELLGSLPVPGLRLARILRVLRISRDTGRFGLRGTWRMLNADRAGSTLLGTLFLTLVVLQFGSMLVLSVEASKETSNIKTASDALWWSITTVTTVGYGDRFPVTNPGRVIGVALLTIGIGLFGVLTGFVTNAVLMPKKTQQGQDRSTSDELQMEIRELKRLVQGLTEHMASQDRPDHDAREPDNT